MRKYKRYLMIAAVLAVALAVTGGIMALVGYNQATKIDRTVTTAVVRQFIDELLVRRDIERAALFECSDRSGLAPFLELRDQIMREERTYGTATQVLPASLTETGVTDVVVDLKINQSSGLHVDRRSQIWRFTLKDEDGWRVCSAERLPDPSPSAIPPTAS